MHTSHAANSPAPGTLHVVATPIGNLGDLSARALETLQDGRCDLRRGHPPHPPAAVAFRPGSAVAGAAPAQRGRPGDAVGGAPAGRRFAGAGVRCRHAAGERSGFPAGARRARGRHPRLAGARRLRGDRRAQRGWRAQRSIRVRRFPAGEGVGAARTAVAPGRRDAHVDLLRVGAPHRGIARRHGQRIRRGAPRGDRSRADQAVRNRARRQPRWAACARRRRCRTSARANSS